MRRWIFASKKIGCKRPHNEWIIWLLWTWMD